MRVVFAGTPGFAATHLQALLESRHQLLAVYTQPDRRAGRGKKLSPGPVKQLALEHQLPVLQPDSLKSPEARASLSKLAPDVMIVVAYGLLLPQAVLDIPQYGCLNVHASLLPRWRGAAPIQRAIETGDRETGITIMQMEAGLDTGPMLATATCPISEDDTSDSLFGKLAQQSPPLLLEVLDGLADNRFPPRPQDDEAATYARKIDKSEAWLDWSRPAAALHRQIRAFNPFPVACTQSRDERLKIHAAEPVALDHLGQAQPPGSLLELNQKGMLVACGDGALRLTLIQLPGKKAMTPHALAQGQRNRFVPGDRFTGPGEVSGN